MSNKLKDLYEGTKKHKKSRMASYLTEFREFRKIPNESLESAYKCFTLMVTNMESHEVIKS